MLIVLDRDGVINFDSDYYIKSPEEWIPIPGSIEAIGQLSQAGYKMVIATNQSGVNRGLYSVETLGLIHQKMLDAIAVVGGKIEKIYFCPHHPDEKCDCRKPNPGMLLQIQRDFKVKSDEMIYIGDSLKDWQAAQTIGCDFVLVTTGNGKKTEHELAGEKSLKKFKNLQAFVASWLR